MNRVGVVAVTCVCVLSIAVAGQETEKPAANSQAQAAKPVLSPTARLQAAKTVTVKRIEGGTLAVDTVTNILDGWGRYAVVEDKPSDLVVEVSCPDEGSGGISVSSSSSTASGKYEESNRSSRELSSGGGTMRIVVRDAKTSTTLFAASEQVKGAMKKNARENNVIEAVQKIMAKFHDRVEPPKPAE